MSDLSDNSDRASLREEQLRDDAVADVRRKQAEAAASYAANGAASECINCGGDIPEGRRQALPYSTVCVFCARDAELLAKGRART
jgi:phage/conjugal plasmid C-4 type zinc finger TraR family protein